MIIRRKLELAMLSVCGLLGLFWAMTTHHLPEITVKLDYLIDISSLLTVASFSVRAMLPLRVLAVASGIMAIPYFMLQPTPLWTPVGWTALFLVINSYHLNLADALLHDNTHLYSVVYWGITPAISA